MRSYRWLMIATAAALHMVAAMPSRAVSGAPAANGFNLQIDKPGSLNFFGPKGAGYFSGEISNSLQGVLTLNYVSHPESGFPAGFLNASPQSQPWSGTMWTRNAGAFLREMVFWGYYEHACQTARCLMDFAGTNQTGFIAFPRYFAPARPHESGAEMDGHAAIIIAMVSLWQRLPAENPFRRTLYNFLNQPSSPVRYLHYLLQQRPLIPGSANLAAVAMKGLYDNVVQNNLCALALLIARPIWKKPRETGPRPNFGATTPKPSIGI